MKRLLLGLSLTVSIYSFAQISEGGLPTTFDKTIVGEYINTQIDYQEVVLAKPNMAMVNSEDIEASEKGKPYRVAILQSVSLSLSNLGTWKSFPNGDKLWQLAIRIPDAQALSLQFSTAVTIPKGGKLHAYNGSHAQFIGAYTSETPSFYSMEMIEGEVLTLEYYMPYGVTELPSIEISEVAYYYRGVEDHVNAFRDGNPVYKLHESCQVDVACSETNGWEEQRDAVLHYSFAQGQSLYVCSASLINNTAEDCTPYVLTANHCGEPTSSSNISNHTWYFNYQRPTCSPGNTAAYNGARSQTMSGGIFKASSELGNYQTTVAGNVSGSDFSLIELNTTIPQSYNPYFAGWNRSTSSANSGVGIHHPSGDEKKISTFSSPTFQYTFNTSWANAHWGLQWATTTNGNGASEQGSSGSPLFDQNGRIVGPLSGGTGNCADVNTFSLYGRIDKAWDQEGSNANQRLKPWLDPISSGVITLDGTYSPCNGGGGSGPCTATSTGCDEYIENVSLNTINKTSACNNYSNFTSTSTSLNKGQAYSLTITPFANGQSGAAYTNDQLAAWIDWNNDGDFTDNGEQIGYVLVGTGWSPVFNFTVPNSASSGSLKMRVRMSYQPDDGVMSPCGTTSWGEVEDYTVVISTGGSSNRINENLLNSVSMYPNPSNNSFTINLEDVSEEIFAVEVTDITGRRVLNITEISSKPVVNLVDEPSGIYLVKLKASSGIYTQKVIKF